ncbi:glycoside hydrolase family 26 protein [Actinocatenispora sera]|uniref:glycoside hydrolase family 26 protein n=1 Tax=Actinocatenispora sera TaxID=390989 RepID=UPI0004C42F11|nr:hypothetical protein [Actinocatenispora sera]
MAVFGGVRGSVVGGRRTGRGRRRAPVSAACALVLALVAAGCGGTPADGARPGVTPGTAASGGHRAPQSRAPEGASVAPSPSCGVDANLVPSCGAWLGIWPRTTATGTKSTDLRGNLAGIERRLGQPITLVSRYYGWNQLPADATDVAWRDSDHLVLMDLRARDFGTDRYASWASIAAGDHDAYLRKVGRRLADYGAPVLFSFNQEPEQELERGTSVAGTAREFAAAYRHVHDVVVAAGARNVRFVWWVMGSMGHTEWYPDLYPGDRYVDWVSYDPYDFNTCHHTGHETPAQSVLPFLHWLDRSGLGDGKPVLLSEFGSNGPARGDWYRGVGELVRKTPRIRGLIAFDSSVAGCDTRVTATDDNWSGFRSIATDPYFRPAYHGGPR